MSGKGTPRTLPGEVITLSAWLELLRRDRFTGSMVIHLHEGDPRVIEWGRPMRADLADGTPELSTPPQNSSPANSLTPPPPPPHTPD